MTLPDFTTQIVPLKHKLFRFALRITGDGPEAEDVVQEVMEKIWVKRHDEATATVNNWEAWCMTMTRNLSIDKTRSKHRSVGSLPEKFELKGSARTPQQEAETRETFATIGQLMTQLPEKQRLVMHLRDIEEQSYDEISLALGISLEDVKVSLHRARKAMRDKLTAHEKPVF